MGITLDAVYTSLYSKLTGGTALTSLVGGTVTPRIYNKVAPDNATMPYVVYSLQAGGQLNINPSEMTDHIIYVRAWGATDASARAVQNQVDALLNGGTLTLSNSYSNFWTMREDDIDRVEQQPNGELRYTYGGLYRIRIDK